MGSYTQTQNGIAPKVADASIAECDAEPHFLSCEVKSLAYFVQTSFSICTWQSYVDWRGGYTSARDKQKGSHRILPAHLGC